MMSYPEAVKITQEQVAVGRHYVILALELGGFAVMAASSYDTTPGSEIHPFALAHDTRRSETENRELFVTACMWQRDTFEQHPPHIKRRIEMYMPIK